jgi:hypothetical protein
MNQLSRSCIVSLLLLCAGCKPAIIQGYYHGFYWKKIDSSWYYFTPWGEQWVRVNSEAGLWHLQGECIARWRERLDSYWDTRDNAFREAEQTCHDHRCEAEQTCNSPITLKDGDVAQPH